MKHNPLATKSLARLLFASSLLIGLAGCGGGGGGGTSDGEATTSSLTGSSHWKAVAPVAADTCGERIAAVQQIFAINGSSVDTGIVTVPQTNTSSGFTFGFAESNGDCNRSYLGEFSNVSGSTADVTLTAMSTCDGKSCSSKWVGTAQKID